MELKPVTLETINDGIIPTLFARELGIVMNNLDDPNTDAKAPRTITLKVKFTATETRDQAAIKVTCMSTLAPVKPTAKIVHLVRRRGRLQAYATDPTQMGIGFEEDPVLEEVRIGD